MVRPGRKGPTLATLLLAAVGVSCGSTDAKFTTAFARGFSPGAHRISVFGVYKEGQMSAEAWDSLAPRLSSWLGHGKCPAGYRGGSPSASFEPLWSDVDEYTRTNGPTDDLLSRLAPAAEGDLVLVLTVAGKVPEEQKARVQDETSQSMQGAGKSGIGGMRNGGGQMFRNPTVAAGDVDALELGALLYAVPSRESVGEVALEYTGHGADDAFGRFAAKLRAAIPSVECAGWNWGGTVRADALRGLGD